VQDLPVILDQYKLTIVEPPAPKMREENGNLVPVLDRQGARQFVVSLFAKLQVPPGQRAPKGEEIKVTLETDPGDGFHEGMRVALVNPRINHFQMENKDDNGRVRVTSGISFKAGALVPAAAPRGEK
jgi:hypothetical protein